jgi:hypothetical protein
MAVLCREFEISRKTGYKIYSRPVDPSACPTAAFQIEKAIVQLKQEHPGWGAPKIRERLRRKHSEMQCPAAGVFIRHLAMTLQSLFRISGRLVLYLFRPRLPLRKLAPVIRVRHVTVQVNTHDQFVELHHARIQA